MAEQIPEFLSLMRDIRDNKYPQINTWHTDVNNVKGEIDTIKLDIDLKYIEVVDIFNKQQNMSVEKPVTPVPTKPDGTEGDPDVSYDPVTNKFTFRIPVGRQGNNFEIEVTYATIALVQAASPSRVGEVAFCQENSSLYIGITTATGSWSSPIPIVAASDFLALTDTPSSYAGNSGKTIIVNQLEDSVEFASAVMASGDQTIDGLKTFSTFPRSPITDPSNDLDFVNKKFVDEKLESVSSYEDTIATLRTRITSPDRIGVTGYATKGDGSFGSLYFEWDSLSTEADNGGTIIKLDTIDTGRYKLKYQGDVNIKWFGAIGDGITDDTTAIQNALNYGEPIFIPNGEFIISDTLVINSSGVNITGSSRNLAKLNMTTIQKIGIELADDSDDITISNLSVHSSAVSTTDDGIAGISVNRSKNISVLNCNISGFNRGAGIRFGYGAAVGGEPFLGRMSKNCLAEGNYIKDCHMGIEGIISETIKIANNTFEDTTLYGVRLNGGGDGHIVTGNMFNNVGISAGYGAMLLGGYSSTGALGQTRENINPIVSNNVFKNIQGTDYGIKFDQHVRGAVIDGNTFTAVEHGLYSTPSENVSLLSDSIISNNVFENLSSGITFRGNMKDVMISNNVISNFTDTAIRLNTLDTDEYMDNVNLIANKINGANGLYGIRSAILYGQRMHCYDNIIALQAGRTPIYDPNTIKFITAKGGIEMNITEAI